MRSSRIDIMKWGWFIGDFNPCALEFDKSEFALKIMKRGKRINSYCHPKALFFLVVLDGCLLVQGVKVKKGKVVYVDYGESINIYAVEDSKILYFVYGRNESEKNKKVDWEIIGKEYELRYKHNNLSKIDDYSKNLSIVVQGAIDKDVTPVVCKRLRRFFPGSRIILSTWEGENVSDLEYDVLIQSIDPGGCKNERIYDFDIEYINNTNRQLVSTQNGLSVAETKYTMKIRTDMIPTTNEFLELFDVYNDSTEELKIFKHKLLISDIYSRHYFAPQMTYVPLLFHPSDWLFFGYTEDVKTYFEKTVPMKEGDMGSYTDLVNPDMKTDSKCQWNGRFLPEQYFAISALLNNGYTIEIKDWTDINADNMWQSEMFFMNNFVPLDFNHHGFLLPKYESFIENNTGGENETKGLITYDVYKKVYEYIYGVSNVGFYEEKFDVEGFYNPFEAVKCHDRFLMKHIRQSSRKELIKLEQPVVDSQNVSVVVQGYVDAKIKETNMVFESIREFLPGAEIILSTWKGCDVDKLDYDKLVLNEDPGGVECGRWENNDNPIVTNNVNRQIMSSKTGVDSAERDYTLKIRSDMVILGSDILNYFGCKEGRIKELTVFSERLLIGELFSRKKYYYEMGGREYCVKTPMHPSDWFVFGKTKDVREYYKHAKEMTKKEAGDYDYKKPEIIKNSHYPFRWRFSPEQQISIGIVKDTFPNFAFNDLSDWNDEIMQWSEEFVFSNFLVLNFEQNRILSLKHDTITYDNTGYSYTEKGLMTNEDEMEWIKKRK